MPEPKLLYIGRSLPCRTETFVYNEIIQLQRLGIEVETLSVHAPQRDLGNAALDSMADHALTIYPQGSVGIFWRFLKEMAAHPLQTLRTLGRSLSKGVKVTVQTVAALSIAEKVREKKIGHIHSHMAHVPTTIAWVLGSHLGIPFSFTGHAADLFRDQVLLEEKLRECAFCVCISSWHRRFYQKIVPMPDHRLPVIRCGVDLSGIEPARPENGSILAVGRLVPKKGFRYLLDALSVLREMEEVFHCIIIGDGPEKNALLAQIKELGLEDYVELKGALPHAEIMGMLRKAQLFVLPCVVGRDGDRDGIPLVLMEAMAHSVPVVAGDLPTIRELIDDQKSGLLIDPRKSSRFAKVIKGILDDESLRKKLSEKGFKRVSEAFDLKENVAKLAVFFAGKKEKPERRRLLIVSPCRDEANYLRRSMDTVLRQTLLPERWVIVDDGSTDGTTAILEEYAEKYPVIRLVRRENCESRRVGPGVVEAFNQGLESEDWKSYDYLCKLDLDLELPENYFENLIKRMEDNPRLGTCSGKAYYANEKGSWISEGCGDEMSQGMTKLYRTKCFEEVGGFVSEVMWDGIDCHRCRMLGWQAKSWNDPELRFLHLRPMGSSQQGIVTGRMRHGYGQYYMGTGPIYMLVSSLYRMAYKPYIVGGIAIFSGYVRAWWKRVPRYEDPVFRKFLRTYQWKCLLFGKRQATKMTDRKQEKKWLENHFGD